MSDLNGHWAPPTPTGAGGQRRLASLIPDEVAVAVVPGEAFGPSGYLRLCYALGDADLAEGKARIQKLLAEGR